jgi:uncharacterized protein YecT (DUF1311 family)
MRRVEEITGRALFPLLVVAALTAPGQARSDDSSAPSKKELDALRTAAKRGDPQAQLDYAKAVWEKSSAQDESRLWAKKAADQGLAEAWFWLGQLASDETAMGYYEKAAEKGCEKAFWELFQRTLFGPDPGSGADVKRAKKYADLARKLHVPLDHDMLQTVDRCHEAGVPRIPAADQPTREEVAAFRRMKAGCRPYRTGIGARRDWAKCRKCLLSGEFVDRNSLAEIYANGWGVKRNPKLAIALVCHGSGVQAELEGMVESLDASEDQAKLEKPFTYCDHATSGSNVGMCAGQAEEIASARRRAVMRQVAEKWSAREKTLFEALQKAAEAFFTERSTGELDMSGTMRSEIAINEESELRRELMKRVRELESGKLPSDADFKRADAELNQVYVKVMKLPSLRTSDPDSPGKVTSSGIRATQRKWLPYRDAWARFGVARYPNVPEAAWKTWVTQQRIEQLKPFLER